MRKSLLLTLLCPLLSTSQPVALKQQNGVGNELPPPLYQPLAIGATVPDIALSGIINHTSTLARLSSFGSGLLILDFWATWCTACLHNFPKLDSLRQQFGGRLGVLLVNAANTGDTRARVEAFLQKRAAREGKPFTLPTLVEDTVLSALFPHRIVPHYVWLNKDLELLAITGSEEVTAQNISKALAGEELALPLKKDIFDYTPAKPLLHEGNGGNHGAATYRSLFTGGIDGLATVFNWHNEGGSHRYTFINHSVPLLYQWAATVPPNRLLARVGDASFCYELTVPGSTPFAAVQALARQDLDRYLGLRSRWQWRPLPCWVLVRTGRGTIPLKSAGGKPSVSVTGEGEGHTITLRNSSLAALVDVLGTGPAGTPVFLNESGITTGVAIPVP